MLELGFVIEYRGVWYPGEDGSDPLNEPPPLTEPSAGYWGWFLSSSAYDAGAHYRPSGLYLADARWTVDDDAPVVGGDWSQPGILWSYVDTTVVERPQPPP